MFLLSACCSVMASYGINEDGMIHILQQLNQNDKIKNMYVLQSDLDSYIRKFLKISA